MNRDDKVENEHQIFRGGWWLVNLLLFVALLSTIGTGAREYSVRKYLSGFSDAVVPEAASTRAKVEAILAWMSNGPPRLEANDAKKLSPHDPTDTLNYRQLLEVCGSATNAFLNLSRSARLRARRLLLLTPERSIKHVVAEVLLEGRWIIVDPTYRVMLQDAQGNFLTRKDLQNPQAFREATGQIPKIVPEYNYDSYAHVRLSAVPLHGFHIRETIDRFFPGWDEYLDWSLLLERQSFLFFFLSVNALLCLLILRVVLGFFADHHFQVNRFRLRNKLSRAIAAFFSAPEIK
jgi:hypothetical protein